ncbi:hypothetical protein QLT00_gp68 [Gordonia phage Commandaria]|uniref:Uncharacterized protein n=1 Tax=Gordonia phage Commandaria TaxID=3038364 RepID=A0AAF0GGB5_9CAUD|nr:hypothetical protein QLT00_gp68 [Gordonia phage Commandaria]WGH20851.1 hypothetical protein [Gordonia phage Commandaria]
MSQSRPHVDPDILEYVEKRYGEVDEVLSTLSYEFGAGGLIRRFLGYLIDTADISPGFVTFLPIRDPEEVNQKKAVFNQEGSKHVRVLRVNNDRVVALMEEILLP